MLQLNHVQAFYGRVQVLSDICLSIPAGKIVCLIGANGAGKSTTLKTISGFLPIAAGSIEFQGRPIHHRSAEDIVALGIVQVPENRRLFKSLTVTENLQAGAYLRRDRRGVETDLAMVCDYFPKLQERRHQFAGTLSGGEQQMLALARGLMAKPALLLLDEPSFGLAPLIVDEIFGIIQRVRQEGVTLLLVEQNARKALLTSDYGYVLVTGKILLHEASGNLLANEEVKKHYLGGKGWPSK